MFIIAALFERIFPGLGRHAPLRVLSTRPRQQTSALTAILASACLGLHAPSNAAAQTTLGAMSVLSGQSRIAQNDPMIVLRDNGGPLEDRIRYLSVLRQSGQRVEIRGQCASACTLYLGLLRTCISRNAVMEFHGPQSQLYGIALPPAQFEYWSRVMADHYPPPLRRWFLAEGRHEIMGVHRIRGEQLINLGVRECG